MALSIVWKMIKTILISNLVFLVLFFTNLSCKQKSNTANTSKKAKFLYESSFSYAKKLRIQHFQGYAKVIIEEPWLGAKQAFEYYLIPRSEKIPSYLDKTKLIFVPVKSIIVLSTTTAIQLEVLGLLDKLVAVDSRANFSSQKIIRRIKKGQIKEVSKGRQINLEMIFELKPDIILSYGIGDPNSDTHPLFIRNKINHLLLATYMEEEALGRLEWIKLLGFLFNKEREALRYFKKVENKYLYFKKQVLNSKYRPKVFFNSPFGGVWYMPGARSWLARIVSDAGGDYLWHDNKNTASIRLNFESVFYRAKNADFWLNPAQDWHSLKDVIKADNRYRYFMAYKRKNIYSNNARLRENRANDFFEGAFIKPHLLLADMIMILHPKILSNHKLNWYKQLK